MKTFRFPLDRVLNIRRAQWEIEQAKLQKLQHDREQLELQATSILTEAASTRRTITSLQLIPAGEISTLPDYQRSSKQHLLKLAERKRELSKRTQDQMRQTAEAGRIVKLLDKLRDQRFAEWNSQMRKEQETFAADAHLARWTVSH